MCSFVGDGNFAVTVTLPSPDFLAVYRLLSSIGDGMVSIFTTSIFTVTLLLAERGLPPYIYRWEKTKTKISINEKQLFVYLHNWQSIVLLVLSNIHQLALKKNPHSNYCGERFTPPDRYWKYLVEWKMRQAIRFAKR